MHLHTLSAGSVVGVVPQISSAAVVAREARASRRRASSLTTLDEQLRREGSAATAAAHAIEQRMRTLASAASESVAHSLLVDPLPLPVMPGPLRPPPPPPPAIAHPVIGTHILSSSSSIALARARALRVASSSVSLSSESVVVPRRSFSEQHDGDGSGGESHVDSFDLAVRGLKEKKRTRRKENEATTRRQPAHATTQMKPNTPPHAAHAMHQRSTAASPVGAAGIRARTFLVTPTNTHATSQPHSYQHRSSHPPSSTSAAAAVAASALPHPSLSLSAIPSQLLVRRAASQPRRRLETALAASVDLALPNSPPPAAGTGVGPHDATRRLSSPGSGPSSPLFDSHRSNSSGAAAAAARVLEHKSRARLAARLLDDAAACVRREKELLAQREAEARWKRRAEVYAINHMRRAFHEKMFEEFMSQREEQARDEGGEEHERRTRDTHANRFDAEIASV